MSITPESMLALKRRVREINYQITQIEDRKINLQKKANDANRRIINVTEELAKLKVEKDKIKEDISL